MRIAVPRETHPGENRVPVTPETAKKLVRLGAEVVIEAGLGEGTGYSDSEYQEVGASISADREALFTQADVLLRLRKPSLEEVALMPEGCIHVSYLDPFNERELIEALRAKGVTSISMEMIPRTTRSQKMDALSSQANLAGYMTVMLGAMHLPRILPMMMTPAGTLKPAKVFVIGAGVAGTTYAARWNGVRVAVKVAGSTFASLEGWQARARCFMMSNHLTSRHLS